VEYGYVVSAFLSVAEPALLVPEPGRGSGWVVDYCDSRKNTPMLDNRPRERIAAPSGLSFLFL